MSTYAYMPGKDEKMREAFIRIGVPEENIFADTWEKGNGTEYKRLLRRVKKGDVLYVQSLDAFGMSMREILNQWRSLTKDRGVDIAALNSPLIDTRLAKEVSGSLVSDVVAEILSFAAHDEYDRQRMVQMAGIERAKKRGVHCGRAPRPLPENFDEVYGKWKKGKITAVEAAKQCNMPVSTFRYRAKNSGQ
ncbi:MAG: recombinase family protein [Clostridia bacterium]|nr:recombinase family protein [Clostridia bacterium]